MPTTYFLSPFQPPAWNGETNLHINLDEYLRQLSQTWRDAKIAINPTSETYIASWEIPTKSDNCIIGGLQKGQTIISCQGSPRGVATFVIWHRQNISSEQRLFLFDESLYLNMELTAGLTLEDIVQRIS
jgi:hypothetical protein